MLTQVLCVRALGVAWTALSVGGLAHVAALLDPMVRGKVETAYGVRRRRSVEMYSPLIAVMVGAPVAAALFATGSVGVLMIVGVPWAPVVAGSVGLAALHFVAVRVRDAKVVLTRKQRRAVAATTALATASIASALPLPLAALAAAMGTAAIVVTLVKSHAPGRAVDAELVREAVAGGANAGESHALLITRGRGAVPAILEFIESSKRHYPIPPKWLLEHLLKVGGREGREAILALIDPTGLPDMSRAAIATMGIDAALEAKAATVTSLCELLPIFLPADLRSVQARLVTLTRDEAGIAEAERLFLAATRHPLVHLQPPAGMLMQRLAEVGSRQAWVVVASMQSHLQSGLMGVADPQSDWLTTLEAIANGPVRASNWPGIDTDAVVATARLRATRWLAGLALRDLASWTKVSPILRRVSPDTLPDPISECRRLIEIFSKSGLENVAGGPVGDRNELARRIDDFCRSIDSVEAWELLAILWSIRNRTWPISVRSTPIICQAREPHRFRALFHRARLEDPERPQDRAIDRLALAEAVVGWGGQPLRHRMANSDTSQRPTDDAIVATVLSALPAAWRAVRGELLEAIGWLQIRCPPAASTRVQ
jgi:hypothetical protein